MSSRPENKQLAESTAVDPSATPFDPSLGLRPALSPGEVTGFAQDEPRASLRIYLLGPPGVEWTGRPLRIPRRQVRALLYRLATQLQPVPRERLCFLFWPDVPESNARRNLSRLLTHLRRSLPDPDVLLTSGEQIGLDPKRAWSDVAAFERLCAAQHPYRQPEALQQAVDLCQGPFLAGFSLPGSPEFEVWASQERYTWERMYLEALESLIEAETARGAYDAAIACAQRYLETNELAEEVHRRLLELYAASGDRSMALRQYERCAVVLERELGVSPLPETRAAYQAVLEGREAVRPSVPRSTWMTLPSLDVPLVGRDDALRRLGRAYARARAGQGRVVLISGEAGIGKSRLMQDFATGLAGRARLVVGSGHETEQGLPYWPLVEALRPHLPAIDWAALGVEPLYLAQVARLLPELRTLLPDLPAPSAVEPAQAQERLFRALAHCLLSLASQPHPLILCLDDLHWADEATLSWLGYLARRLKRAPVLVVGAYRTEEAAAVAALRAGLRRLGVMEEVRLKGLPVTEVLHMVRHLSGQSSGAELFSQRLHWETGGNPFYLLETLRAMFEAGILWQDETGWSTNVDETTEDYRELPLPDTVGQAIRDRVRRLSPQSCQVLEAGAVIGHRFDFDLVRVTSGRRESEVVDALDALLARQVISEHDDRYRFNHDIIRTVVYGDLSYGRRRLLHRRAGEALEKLQLGQAARYAEVGRTADIVVQLARHFQAAGIAEKAILYLGRAGNNAVYLSANQEAITHLTKGLELLKTLPDTPERTQQELDLQITLGPALMATRGYAAPEVGNAYVRARELCRQVGETSQLFPVVWGLWAFYLLRAELQTAHELGERLLSLAQSVRQSALLLQAQHALGVTLFHLGEVASARVHLEQGIALYDPQQHHSHAFLYGHDPGVVCLSYVARALWHLGYPDQALDRSCQAVTLAQELSHPYSLAFALAFTAYLHHFLRERQATQERLEELMPLCTEQGFAQWLSAGTHLQGWALTEQGQEEEGIGQMRQSLAADRATGTGLGRPWLLAPLAEAYGKVGQAEEGLTVLAEALDFANKKGERWYEAELHRLKGELLLMQGEGEADTSATLSTRVEACFQHAIEIARQQSAKTFELRAVMSLSRLLQSQGKGEEAQGMLAEIYGWFTEGFDTPDLQEARALLEELS